MKTKHNPDIFGISDKMILLMVIADDIFSHYIFEKRVLKKVFIIMNMARMYYIDKDSKDICYKRCCSSELSIHVFILGGKKNHYLYKNIKQHN